MKPLHSAVAILSILSATVCSAGDPTYDNSNRSLTIPSITIGDTAYTNLVIRFDAITVTDIGNSVKISGPGALPKSCPSTIPKANYDKITIGMTISQVNQILGCQYTSKSFYSDSNIGTNEPNYITYNWVINSNQALIPGMISVYFDPQGKGVWSRSGDQNPALFKTVVSPSTTLSQ